MTENEQPYTPSLDEVREAYLVIAKASYDDDQNAVRRMIEVVRAEEREKALNEAVSIVSDLRPGGIEKIFDRATRVRPAWVRDEILWEAQSAIAARIREQGKEQGA